MRQYNGTTVTGGSAILGLFAAAFFQMGSLGGDIAAWVCTGLAGFVFVRGWLLPRILGGRRREEADQEDGVATNQAGTIRAEANLTRRSDGGISFETSLSATVGEEADGDENEEEEGPGGT